MNYQMLCHRQVPEIEIYLKKKNKTELGQFQRGGYNWMQSLPHPFSTLRLANRACYYAYQIPNIDIYVYVIILSYKEVHPQIAENISTL